MFNKNRFSLLRSIIRSALCCLILASNTTTGDVIFSEYIEGSSNNKALEIQNSGNSAVDLSGYEVQFYFNGSVSAGLTIGLQGTLAPGAVHVLAHSSASPDILAQADQTNGSGWFNGDDAVALSYAGIAVDVLGQIGVDPGSQWGTGDSATTNRTLRRKPTISTGDPDGFNSFDPAVEWTGFAQDAFDDLGSHNSGGDPDPESPDHDQCGDDGATRIHTIQGSGAATPLAGSVQTIEGIVVGDFQGSEQLSGFFVQEEDVEQDKDPATSEAIFIFQGSLETDLNMGDQVRVTGTVSEYFDMTQISATQISVCGAGFSVTPTHVSLPVSDLSALEAVEGMAVTLVQTLTVTENYNLGRFGELVLSANGRLFNPTQIAEPGIPAQAVAEANRLRRLLLDDGSSSQNPATIVYPQPQLTAINTVRSGDAVQNLQGVLHYAFGEYRIQPTFPVQFVATNARTSAPDLIAGTLKVASFNVLNYFNGDGLGGGFPTSRGAHTAAEFSKQRAKILSALVALDADVVGLIEIENDGYGLQSAIADLLAGLADAGLAYTLVNPGRAQIGTDEITVGFIYKPAKVELVGDATILDATVNPAFLDTKNRPVLAQSFREIATGGVFTVAVAHLKSKGSDCLDVNDPDMGDGQGNCNLTRTAAATAIAAWLASDPTNSGDSDHLLIGDLNAYAKEDPITTLEAAGFINLLRDQHGDSAYSYVFEGQAGYLDYALANSSLHAQVRDTSEWHINADEPRVLDYNEEFKTSAQIVDLYSPEAWRSSDHDPLLVQLNLDSALPPPVRGDFNGNRVLDTADLALLVHQVGKKVTSANQKYDLNRDGRILVADLLLWTKWYLESRRR